MNDKIVHSYEKINYVIYKWNKRISFLSTLKIELEEYTSNRSLPISHVEQNQPWLSWKGL